MDTAESAPAQQLPCAKYNRHQDSRNPRCSDPELYCKHRTACLIHFIEKNGQRRDDDG